MIDKYKYGICSNLFLKLDCGDLIPSSWLVQKRSELDVVSVQRPVGDIVERILESHVGKCDQQQLTF